MKHKILKERYQKVIDEEIEIDLPEEPEYHFETGIRRSIAIIPEWTTWKKEKGEEEEIYNLVFVCVYGSWEHKVETESIRVSELSRLVQMDKTGRSLATFLVQHRDQYTRRTKEQFMADYNNAITNFNHALKLEVTNEVQS